ncbi:hypothetical protein ACT7DB_00560 [Bacillus cereus]
MGLFSFLEKRNADETISYSSQPLIPQSIFAFNKITEEDVLKIPSAKTCLDAICDQIASLPIHLYQEHEDGSIERILVDNRLKLLNEEPNDFTKRTRFKKTHGKRICFTWNVIRSKS